MSEKDRELEAAARALRVEDEGEACPPADEALAGAAARWEVRFGELARALPPEAPRPELLDEVLARVRTAEGRGKWTVTVRAEEGTWRPFAPGVTVKLLWADRQSGRRAVLMRVEPGSTYPSHAHEVDEECLVLEGELRFGDLVLRAGDFHLARAGHRHPPATSPGGCLLYVSGAL